MTDAKNEADSGASRSDAVLDIEQWKKKTRPCGLPYSVMCNCFRCLRARLKAGKEYEQMPNAEFSGERSESAATTG